MPTPVTPAQPSPPTSAERSDHARPHRIPDRHLNVAVPDLAAAKAFYEPVLATLDIHPPLDIPATPADPAMTGYGWTDTKPFLWFIDNGTVGTNMHLALAAGAQPLHPPRTHPEYHEHYYGAFVLDRHGINLEAVCHRPD